MDENILKFINNTASSAEMTSGLKNIGDGDMKRGILKILNYVDSTAKNKYIVEGIFIGGTTIVSVQVVTKFLKKCIDKSRRAKRIKEDVSNRLDEINKAETCIEYEECEL